MSAYTDTNLIRNGLLALQVLALANADEYLEKLAVDGVTCPECQVVIAVVREHLSR
jgi:hypothetical protein